MLYPEIAKELAQMRQLDQESQMTTGWDINIVKKHTQRLKEIIVQIGWPNITKVGETGSIDAWLLVQHSDHDLAFQKECLELMQKEPDKEIRKPDLALLVDRVRKNNGQKQYYGSQVKKLPDGRIVPFPDIEDPETVDQRRHEMQLQPLAEYIDFVHQMNKKIEKRRQEFKEKQK